MSLIKGFNRGSYATMRVQKPRARTEDLLIEQLETELLVYDSQNHRAHCLGGTAARVWRACDGATDMQSLAIALQLTAEEVSNAVDELERSQLLDGLPVLDVTSRKDSGITRREMTLRSAKLGGAIASAPLIYSIAVPSPAAAATPTPYQCNLYTTQDCGTSHGCGAIAGCCCCDVSCAAQGSCKLCSSVSFCNAGNQECLSGGAKAAHCSTQSGSQTVAANSAGCCGISGSLQCGCAYGAGGVAGTGGVGGGAGCCDPSTQLPCLPGATNCVPCCNGTPIPTGANLECCTAGLTSTC